MKSSNISHFQVVMNFIIPIKITILATILYNVCSDEDREMTDEELSELFNSDMFKFLETIDDEDLMSDDNATHIGNANEDTYCYYRDDNPYHYFSTKTAYPEYNESKELDPAPSKYKSPLKLKYKSMYIH